MREKLMRMLEEREDEMIAIRRHLHQHPEVSFQEKETAAYITDFYKGKDMDLKTEVGNGHGIVVTIKGASPGKTIGLRADFDALPIREQTGLSFASENEGAMHACGHDAHTAYLLVLADCLIQLKDELQGTVKIIHQHAEEQPPGGAKSILDSGILDDVDTIFGIHLLPVAPAGTIGYHSGYAFNGRTYFKLNIMGSGGHGSSPHMANDPIVVGSYFVTAAQTVVSRRLDPLSTGVVTVGSFDGKGTFNVIKDNVELEGDIRYADSQAQEVIDKEIHRITEGLEAMFGVTCKLTYTADYPPLYNDPEWTLFVKESLQEVNDEAIEAVTSFPYLTASDDFAYYLEKIPGSYFYIGCSPKEMEEPYFNHHPKFDIDEDAILVAAKAVGHTVCSYVEKTT